MSDNSKKKEDNKIQIRCTKCDKLLGKRLSPDNLEIKCLRCGAIEVILTKDI